MSWIQRKAAHCDACGHEWLSEGYPKRCAKCKSMKWNSVVNVYSTSTLIKDSDPEEGVISQLAEVKAIEKKSKESRGKADGKPCPHCEKPMTPWGSGWHCFGCERNYPAE